MTLQNVDLYQPIMASRPGASPVALRIGVRPVAQETANGPVSGATKVETYVLLSALPEELRRRVELAVQILIQGG